MAREVARYKLEIMRVQVIRCGLHVTISRFQQGPINHEIT